MFCKPKREYNNWGRVALGVAVLGVGFWGISLVNDKAANLVTDKAFGLIFK